MPPGNQGPQNPTSPDPSSGVSALLRRLLPTLAPCAATVEGGGARLEGRPRSRSDDKVLPTLPLPSQQGHRPPLPSAWLRRTPLGLGPSPMAFLF